MRYRAANASGNMPFLAEIMAQKEGRPDWRRVGRDFPMNFRESRNNRWVGVPSFGALIAAKDDIFSDPPPARYRGD